jgi:hypothetical protein
MRVLFAEAWQLLGITHRSHKTSRTEKLVPRKFSDPDRVRAESTNQERARLVRLERPLGLARLSQDKSHFRPHVPAILVWAKYTEQFSCRPRGVHRQWFEV